ncbi:hypothetical protein BH23GEM7_BH23GEM7_21120 [soil metagenome]
MRLTLRAPGDEQLISSNDAMESALMGRSYTAPAFDSHIPINGHTPASGGCNAQHTVSLDRPLFHLLLRSRPGAERARSPFQLGGNAGAGNETSEARHRTRADPRRLARADPAAARRPYSAHVRGGGAGGFGGVVRRPFSVAQLRRHLRDPGPGQLCGEGGKNGWCDRRRPRTAGCPSRHPSMPRRLGRSRNPVWCVTRRCIGHNDHRRSWGCSRRRCHRCPVKAVEDCLPGVHRWLIEGKSP